MVRIAGMAWPDLQVVRFLHEYWRGFGRSLVMATLPSLLDETVADGEPLARFLLSSSQFNSGAVKASAFIPNPKDQESSVFRHGSEPREGLWAIAATEVARERTIYGAGILTAAQVREVKLAVNSAEPPPRHAVITGWPWFPSDPHDQKARQKELALLLASQATLVMR